MANSSFLSKESPTNGLDLEASKIWIYPTNYPIREYQYLIVEKALFENTLVSLPTGLGKTFIAAVLMYNFYRWYPTSKIIFMAPTKPLVKQQLDACYDVMAIPKIVTAEFTGNNLQTSRTKVWDEKRVFFITPQILQNDLDLSSSLASQIKCLVIDEAHKAKGGHAYCEVVRKLHAVNKHFRVLALSATPGKDDHELANIVKNLLISRVEFRTDESPDVVPYLHAKNIIPIVVDLDEKLINVKEEFVQILEIYTRPLVRQNLINGNCGNLSKGRIFMLMKDYQERSRTNGKFLPEILRNFNICLTLYHGYDLLLKNGLRSFLVYFNEHLSNPLLQNNEKLESILEDLKKYLGPELKVTPLPDGTIMQTPKIEKYGHPKFKIMCDILEEHFSTNGENSRAIIFCEYCEGVREAYAILLEYGPTIKPKCFMGQNSLTQRQQISIVKSFRNGECNCLISTSIGEEGLDIGEVDLIICFDICSKSPTRMIQRIGRTGRKKNGKVFVLATRGKEEQVFTDCLARKKGLTKRISNSFNTLAFFKENPRMIPENITPKCEKRNIYVNKSSSDNKSLKAMFNNISSKKSATLAEKLNEIDVIEVQNHLPKQLLLSVAKEPISEDIEEFCKSINTTKKSNSCKSFRPKFNYASVNGQILDSLYQQIEFKKYNLPISELNNVKIDQLKMVNNAGNSNGDGLKQCDIRNLFTKSKELPSSYEELSTKNTTNVFDKPDFIELNEQISNYLSLNAYRENTCDLCSSTFQCNDWLRNRKNLNDLVWLDISESIVDKIDTDILNDYTTVYDCIDDCIQDDDLQMEMENDCLETPSLSEDYHFDVVLSFFKLNALEDIFVPLDESVEMVKLWSEFERIRQVDKMNVEVEYNGDSSEISLVENSYIATPLKGISADFKATNGLIQLPSPPKQTALHSKQVFSVISPNDTRRTQSYEDNKEIILKASDQSACNSKQRTPEAKIIDTYVMSKNRPNLSALKLNKTFFFNPIKVTESHEKSIKPDKNVNTSKELVHSFCDMSIFGLNDSFIQDDAITSTNKSIDISDVCDLSIFGLEKSKENHLNGKKSDTKVNGKLSDNKKTSKKTVSNSDDDFDITQTSEKLKSQESTKSNESHLETSLKNSQESPSPRLKKKNIFTLRSFKTHTNTNDEPKQSTTTKSSFGDVNKLNKNKSSDLRDDDFVSKKSIDLCGDDFKSNPANVSKSDHESPVKKVRRKNNKRKICSFIDNEAEVSIIISSDEDVEDDNKLESSFVDDSVLEDVNITTMQNIYLQSTRSPIKNVGQFKIPKLKPIQHRSNIFSQEVSVLNDTYSYDSFCVVDDSSSDNEELSELEKLEIILKAKKRKRNKKYSLNTKRKRISIEISDESD